MYSISQNIRFMPKLKVGHAPPYGALYLFISAAVAHTASDIDELGATFLLYN